MIRLHSRISKFYDSLNSKNWEACFDMLDPKLRAERVKYRVYSDSLASFFEEHGPIKIVAIEDMEPRHVKNHLYGDRPFALGTVRWQDKQDRSHAFRECWIKFRGTWYSRKTGLV